jgi:hypothetical protein
MSLKIGSHPLISDKGSICESRSGMIVKEWESNGPCQDISPDSTRTSEWEKILTSMKVLERLHPYRYELVWQEATR